MDNQRPNLLYHPMADDVEYHPSIIEAFYKSYGRKPPKHFLTIRLWLYKKPWVHTIRIWWWSRLHRQLLKRRVRRCAERAQFYLKLYYRHADMPDLQADFERDVRSEYAEMCELLGRPISEEECARLPLEVIARCVGYKPKQYPMFKRLRQWLYALRPSWIRKRQSANDVRKVIHSLLNCFNIDTGVESIPGWRPKLLEAMRMEYARLAKFGVHTLTEEECMRLSEKEIARRVGYQPMQKPG